MITLEGCKKVTVLKNKLIGDVLGKNIKLVSAIQGDLKLGKRQGVLIEGN
jgi:hypothetical protein